MRLLDRHITGTVARIGLVSLLLCTLMLMSVDLFTHLDSYARNEIPAFTIFKLTVLYLPEATLFSLAPALLFSATFFLSQLQANNELISLYNTGVSYRRIIVPILLLGLGFSVCQFAVDELVAIPATRQRSALQDSLFGLSSTYDNRNITLGDLAEGYVIHASRYNDKAGRITDVSLVLLDGDRVLDSRIDAPYALWDQQKGHWIFKDAIVHTIVDGGVDARREAEWDELPVTLEPNLFRNLSTNIKTMEFGTALRYLRRIRVLSPSQWNSYATDFAERTLGALTPLVLLFIACTINYRYKKNILLFSVITSLGISVIYYVVQMVCLIMARQGIIGPVWGMAIPMIVIVCIAIAERYLFR
jgi:lipopolysaccharide export system permease protein